MLLLASRARRPLGWAAAVPEDRSVGGEGGEGAAAALLGRLQPAVPSVYPGAFEPAVRPHRATEGLGGDLARRRGHCGGEEAEDGDDDSGEDDDAAAGALPRSPSRRGFIR